MNSLKLESPAKINLCLYVLGKRRDGYHDLITLLQRISLADRITFRKIKKGIIIRCSDSIIPTDSRNLIHKAYDLLKTRIGFRGGVEVYLEKQIPAASGLGGGSSDAASSLLALDRLFRLGLRRDELVSLGKKIGADVPFFLLEISQALGKNRGDELTPIIFSTKLSLCLTFLPSGLSTKSVYQRHKSTRKSLLLTKLTCDATMLSAFLASRDLSGASVLLRNDLLRPAVQIKPAIGRVLSFLSRFQPASMMSGSGPTLFTLASDRREAIAVAKRIRAKFGLASWVGSTC